MEAGFPLPKDVWERTPPEAQALILSLLREVAELRERVGQLERERDKKPDPPKEQKISKPAPPRTKSGKKRGGQPGHKAAFQALVPPEKVKEIIPVHPESCEHCGTALAGDDPDPQRHQVVELPPVEVEVIEYQLHALTCTQCGQTTRAALPAGVPQGHFGPRLTSILALLRGAYRLSIRSIQEVVADLFGLTISIGMICKLSQKTAEVLEEPYKQLSDQIPTESANIDETRWRENRGRAVLWTVVTATVTVFRIAPTKAAAVLRALIGVSYAYVVGCDRAKAYRWVRRLQWCWAHLRRDFQAMINRGGEAGKVGAELLHLADTMFEWWHRVRDGTLSRRSFQNYLVSIRSLVYEQLERGLECGCAATAATCADLLDNFHNLWHFATVEGVEPTNNRAEQAHRHLVQWRKLCYGSDSTTGSRFVERIGSVVATCRRHQRHVLDYLTQCHEARLHGKPIPLLLPQPEQHLSQAA